MRFVQFCVGFVIFIISMFASGGLGGLITMGDYDDKHWYIASWGVSALGFAICLTMLLYQNGIIK